MRLRFARLPHVGIVVSAFLACWSVPAAAQASPVRQNCHVDFDRLETGSLDGSQRVLPVRFSVTCPIGVAWQLAAMPQSGACDGTFDLDYDGATVALVLFAPNGARWCDGTDGSTAPSGVGTGAPQTFFARAYVQPPRTVPILAGRHSATIPFELRSR